MDPRPPAGAPRVPGYTVERLLDGGGDATEWSAVGRSGERVALKVFRSRTPSDVETARREAALLAAVDHPHVMRALELVETGGSLVLVLPLAEGGSLEQLVRARGVLEPGEVVTACAPVAQALAGVHARGLVHGDVSAATVLLTAEGLPLLADLGVSRLSGGTSPRGAAPGITAPEVLAGSPATAAADVYGLAAAAVLALTGRAPDRLVSLPGIAPATSGAIGRCLDRDPGRRPSAAVLASALFAMAEPEAIGLVLPPGRGAGASGAAGAAGAEPRPPAPAPAAEPSGARSHAGSHRARRGGHAAAPAEGTPRPADSAATGGGRRRRRTGTSAAAAAAAGAAAGTAGAARTSGAAAGPAGAAAGTSDAAAVSRDADSLPVRDAGSRRGRDSGSLPEAESGSRPVVDAGSPPVVGASHRPDPEDGTLPPADSRSRPAEATGTRAQSQPVVDTGGQRHPDAGDQRAGDSGSQSLVDTDSQSLVESGGHLPVETGWPSLLESGSRPAVDSESQPPVEAGGHLPVETGWPSLLETGSQPEVDTGAQPLVESASLPVADSGPQPEVGRAETDATATADLTEAAPVDPVATVPPVAPASRRERRTSGPGPDRTAGPARAPDARTRGVPARVPGDGDLDAPRQGRRRLSKVDVGLIALGATLLATLVGAVIIGSQFIGGSGDEAQPPLPPPSPQPTAVEGAAVAAEVCGAPAPAPEAAPDTAVDWTPVLEDLYEQRSRAFETLDPSLLCDVYVPTSTGLAADIELIREYAEAGVRPADIDFTIVSTELVSQEGASVTLLVTDELPPYDLIDSDRDVVREQQGLPEESWDAEMLPSADGRSWRFG